MNWLNHRLILGYLNPSTTRYQLIYFINRYPYRVMAGIVVLIVLYPLIVLGYVYRQHNQIEWHLVEAKEKLVNKQKLFNSIEQRQVTQYQKSQQFAEFDLNIKAILKEHQVEIDYLQWYFSPYKRIEIGLNGRSKDIFRVLNALHKLNYLFTQDIHMIKLYQDQKVQINAHFIIRE